MLPSLLIVLYPPLEYDTTSQASNGRTYVTRGATYCSFMIVNLRYLLAAVYRAAQCIP